MNNTTTISRDSILTAGAPIVYPNPAVNYVNIVSNAVGKGTASLYSVSGKVIMNKQIVNRQQLDISSVPAGIYFIRIVNSSGTYLTKIIKQ